MEKGIDFTINSHKRCLPPIRQIVLDGRITKQLLQTYKILYPDIQINSISQFARQSSRATVVEELFGSVLTSRDNCTVISAYWSIGIESASFPGLAMPFSIGQIQYFIKHDLISTQNSEKKEHIFAYVNWYKQHQNFDSFGSSAVVCLPEFVCKSFIPIQRISSVCIFGQLKLSFSSNMQETVLLVSPTHSNHCYS